MARPRGLPLTRESVIEAAIAGLGRHGLEGFGINRVARELGIKPPSLYNHVASNEDLHRAVVLAGWHRLAQGLNEAAGSQGDPMTVLRRVADAFRTFVHANPALYSLISSPTVEESDPVLVAIRQGILEDFERILSPLGLAGPALVHAVRTMRSAMHGFLLLELAGQFGPMSGVAESYEWMLQALMRAIQSQSRPVEVTP